MSIFEEIVRSILIKEIGIISGTSIGKDTSFLNQTATLITFGVLGRNESLSKKKISTVTALLSDIQSRKFEHLNDEEITASWQQMISECRETLAKLCKENDQNQGTVGPSLDKLLQILKDIYVQFNKKNLLNTASDGKPLNTFFYYCAKYFAEKIEANYKVEESFLLNALQNPNVTKNRELERKKEILLTNAISSCLENLDLLDKSNEKYWYGVKTCILQDIDHLLRENEELTKEYNRGKGSLDEYMSEARNKVEEINVSEYALLQLSSNTPVL